MGADSSSMYEDGTYLESNPTWHAEDSVWKAEKILQMLRSNGVAPATVCEVGCGAGGILAHMAEKMGDAVMFTGYEVSPLAFNLCETKAKANLGFYLKDIREEKDQAFDLVMAIDVVEHVEDLYGFLRMLRSKATYKLFHIPLEISMQSLLRVTPLMLSRQHYGHIHHFMKDTALDALKTGGCEIIDWCYTPYLLEMVKLGWRGRCLKPLLKVCYRLCPDLAVRLFGGFSLLVLTR